MSSPEYIVIDVREPFEYSMGHIANAINVPSESLMNGVPELNSVSKGASIIVYCKTGSRSGLAIQILQSMGFTNLINGINKEMVVVNFGVKLESNNKNN